MTAFKDIQKSSTYPNASKDSKWQQLLELNRVQVLSPSIELCLLGENVDVITIGQHGHSKSVVDTLKYIKKNYPSQQVIAGNIATSEAAEALIKVSRRN